MANKKIMIITFIVLFIAISSSLYALATKKDSVTDEPNKLIENAFSELKGQTNSISKDNYVVTAGDIQISKAEFQFYKVNIKLIYQLNETLDNPSNKTNSIPYDQELIDEMLKKRLSVNQAKNSGITVGKDEVEKVINREKNMLHRDDLDEQNQALIKEIMNHRINITGLSEEDFWKSDLVFKEYENVLYIDKLYNKLISEKEISDIHDFEKFQNHLLEQYKNEYGINLDNLNG